MAAPFGAYIASRISQKVWLALVGLLVIIISTANLMPGLLRILF